MPHPTPTPTTSALLYISSGACLGAPTPCPNEVIVLNIDTMSVIANVATGPVPMGIGMFPDRSRAYVANNEGGTVSVIETLQNTVTATIDVEKAPSAVAISPDSKLAYVANTNSNSVSVIDTAHNVVINTIPVGMGPWELAFTSDGTKLYVANSGFWNSTGGASLPDASISVIDVAIGMVIKTLGPQEFPRAVVASPTAHRMYVVEPGFGLEVISTDTDQIVRRIPFGFALSGDIAVSPDGRRIYVPDGGFKDPYTGRTVVPSTLFVIDAAELSIIAAPQTDPGISSIALTPDGATAFLTYYPSGLISFDTKALKFKGGVVNLELEAVGMALLAGPAPIPIPSPTPPPTPTPSPTPSPALLYLSDNCGGNILCSGRVAVFDTATMQIVKAIPAGQGTGAIAMLPDRSHAYVANSGAGGTDGTVSVIDTQQSAVTATIGVGKVPAAIAISPDGNLAYVANRFSDSVSIIDTASNQVVNTVAVGSFPGDLAFSSDGTKVYIANNGASALLTPGSISVIDVATATVTATITTRSFPTGIAASPTGRLMYVGEPGYGLEIIATDTNEVLNSIGYFLNFQDRIAVSPDGSRIYLFNAGISQPGYSEASTLYVIDAVSHLIVAAPQADPALSFMVFTPDGSEAFLGFSTLASSGIQSLDTKATKFTSNVTHLPIQLNGMALVQTH